MIKTNHASRVDRWLFVMHRGVTDGTISWASGVHLKLIRQDKGLGVGQ